MKMLTLSIISIASIASMVSMASSAKADVVELSQVHIFSVGLNEVNIRAYSTSALNLFDKLEATIETVEHTEGVYSVEQVKKVNGIVCSKSIQDPQSSECSMDLNVREGMLQAVRGSSNLNLPIYGITAKYLYEEAMKDVKETIPDQDTEHMNYLKELKGISCQKITGVYSCYITAHTKNGIIQ